MRRLVAAFCVRPGAFSRHVPIGAASRSYITSMSYEDSSHEPRRYGQATAPGTSGSITYWLGNTLYVGVTNRCNTTPLHASRGPGFKMPASSEFRSLPQASEEPSAQAIINATQGDLALSHARGLIKQEVVFAGWGEPTLRWHVVCEVAEYLRKTNRHVKLRLNTNGLGSVASQRSIVPEVASLFDCVTVGLNSAYPGQYDELMLPDLSMRTEALAIRPLTVTQGAQRLGEASSAHAQVVAFIRGCVQSDVRTTVTGVARPDVDLVTLKQLVGGLGAEFRSRAYFE